METRFITLWTITMSFLLETKQEFALTDSVEKQGEIRGNEMPTIRAPSNSVLAKCTIKEMQHSPFH